MFLYILAEHVWWNTFHPANSSVLVNEVGPELHRWSTRSKMKAFSFYLNTVLLFRATCCSAFILCFLLQRDKLLSSRFLRVGLYLGPSNIELKDSQDISQTACNTRQKQYLTLCLGGNAIEAQMNQAVWSNFSMHSLYGKKDKPEIAMHFSVIACTECFIFDIRIPVIARLSALCTPKWCTMTQKSQILL